MRVPIPGEAKGCKQRLRIDLVLEQVVEGVLRQEHISGERRRASGVTVGGQAGGFKLELNSFGGQYLMKIGDWALVDALR